MNFIFAKFKLILLFPFIPFRSFYFWMVTDKNKLPGKDFAKFGFKIGIKLIGKGKLSPKLLLNPVSIVRYFEFDYAYSNINHNEDKAILDVSSPYLFGFFLCSKNRFTYNYINPDEKDLNNVISLSNKLKMEGNYSAESVDARTLPYSANRFDSIISISVIEHIGNDGDSEVMREMWRVLKPNGKLILTFPVKKIYDEEYRDRNEYDLNSTEADGKYFFQRIYDEESIQNRLLSSIDNFDIVDKKIFGEITENFYDDYKVRWIKNGYWETVKDPYYIAKNFQYFSSVNDLKNIGVMGLTINKMK
jgi:SAM-dependent methyltransferase